MKLLTPNARLAILDFISQLAAGSAFLVLTKVFGLSVLGDFYTKVFYLQLVIVVATNVFSREVLYSDEITKYTFIDWQVITRTLFGLIFAIILHLHFGYTVFIVVYIVSEIINEKYESYLIIDPSFRMRSTILKLLFSILWIFAILTGDNIQILFITFLILPFCRLMINILLLINTRRYTYIEFAESSILWDKLKLSLPFVISRGLPIAFDTFVMSTFNNFSPSFSGIFVLINRLGGIINVGLQSVYRVTLYRSMQAQSGVVKFLEKWVLNIFTLLSFFTFIIYFLYVSFIERLPSYLIYELFVPIIIIIDSFYVMNALTRRLQWRVMILSVPQVVILGYLVLITGKNISLMSLVKIETLLFFSIVNMLLLGSMDSSTRGKFLIVYIVNILVIYVNWHYSN